MTDAETERLAKSGAVAGLCPITEANLGDGVFPTDGLSRGRRRVRRRHRLQHPDRRGRGTAPARICPAPAHRAATCWRRAGALDRRRAVARRLAGGAQALGAGRRAAPSARPADFITLDAGHPASPGGAATRCSTAGSSPPRTARSTRLAAGQAGRPAAAIMPARRSPRAIARRCSRPCWHEPRPRCTSAFAAISRTASARATGRPATACRSRPS
jgi:hypothetical protein